MEYILDVSKWRCGGWGPHQLGTGKVLMCNEKGYMCCLGQFATQKGVDYSKVEKDHLYLMCCSPEDLVASFGLYDETFLFSDRREIQNKNLVDDLVYINDCTGTSPKEKIEKIREKLEEHGHTLKILNEDILDV